MPRADRRHRPCSGEPPMRWPAILAAMGLSGCAPGALHDGTVADSLQTFTDPTGRFATFDANGPPALDGPFFQSLGTNGRSCGSCHKAADGWSIVPAHLEERFDATEGLDPVFRPVDGATSPLAD